MGAGGKVSSYLARLTTTCPAAVTLHGSGCTGSAGPVVLMSRQLPWIGGTYRSIATGLPANAFAVAVRGQLPVSIALPALFPQGVSGCLLLVSPVAHELLVPTAGTVLSQFSIPNTAALVGQVQYDQVVPVELDTSSNIMAITSSNALRLTIGSF